MVNLKKIIPIKAKYYLKYLNSSRKDEIFERFKYQKKIIIALAADYGNLGDVAITYAQTELFKNFFPQYKILELPISETFSKIKALKNICSTEDIITIVGGGNMGDLYDEIEYCRQFVIKNFLRNKIISFPQTIYFTHTAHGQKKLGETIKAYSLHKNLTLIARDRISHDTMKEFFPKNTVLLVPDIVMSLDKTKPQFKRNGIILCLRNDKEKLSTIITEQYISKLKNLFGDVHCYDTHIDRSEMSVQERKIELTKIWDTFKHARVVVTDRLHGMIFCFITKTPCLVFPNNNFKIKASFEWIKDCAYIKFCDDFAINKVQEDIRQLSVIDSNKMSKLDLSGYFNCLRNFF